MVRPNRTDPNKWVGVTLLLSKGSVFKYIITWMNSNQLKKIHVIIF